MEVGRISYNLEFFSIGGGGEETMRKQETLPKPPQSIAPSQFISVRCGIFTEMTIGESEILSEKEGAPCDHSEDGYRRTRPRANK